MNPVRRLGMMLRYLLGVLAVVVSANWLANPYGIWSPHLVDKIYYGLGPGADRLKAPYRVRSEQPTTLLLGSSRMLYGIPVEQGCRDGVFNAGLSGASVDEIASLLHVARHNSHLKRVVWGLDFFAFQESFRGFRDEPTRARLDGDRSLLVRDTLLSTKALQESWKLVYAAVRGRQRLPATALLSVPWPEGVIRDVLQALATQSSAGLDEQKFTRDLRQWVDLYTDFQLSSTQLDLLRDTVAQLTATGVEVILLIPPLHEYELEAIRQTGRWPAFQEWKRALAGIAPYWDYTGYNELARTDWLFTAACFCHFHPVVGHVMLRQMLGEDCSQCGDVHVIHEAAARIDPASVAQHLADEDALLQARVGSQSRYARLTSSVLRH